MMRLGLNQIIVILFVVFEIIQLIYFFNTDPKIETPNPNPISEEKDELTLEKVFKRCLKSYNLAIRTRPNLNINENEQPDLYNKLNNPVDPDHRVPSPEDDENPYKYRPEVKCQEGYWDKTRRVCQCDMGFTGDDCSIPIQFCKFDTDRQKTFDNIYDTLYWGSKESRSGAGSTMYYTEKVRQMIPVYVKKYNITTMIDSPCGDLNWMKTVEFPEKFEYVGVDVVRKMVVGHREKYKDSDKYHFVHRDTVMFPPFKSFDLIFSRDMLQHLSHPERERVIKNWENSGSKYVLTTYYTGMWDNSDMESGGTRNVNLMEPPYNWVDPLESFIDRNPADPVKEGDWIKNMGIWELPIKKRK